MLSQMARPPHLSRGFRILFAVLVLLPGFVHPCPVHAQDQGKAGDWALYGGDGGRRFSALAQITRGNVGKLTQAWRFDMPEAGDPQTHP
jgi:hypothetical protein